MASLTSTASSIWLAAAVGTGAGLGMYDLALSGTLVSLVVLGVLRPLEKLMERKTKTVASKDTQGT